MVTSGRGCAEQAALACGRSGGGSAQPAPRGREMKNPLYQLLLSSRGGTEKSSPATQRMQNTEREEENKAWPVPFLWLSVTSSCGMDPISRSKPTDVRPLP